MPKSDSILIIGEYKRGMLNLNSILIGTTQPIVLAEFYSKIIGRPADMSSGGWYGWQIGNTFLTIGEHSEVKGEAKEPQRLIFNMETNDFENEYERIRKTGAEVVKEAYQIQEMMVATFADPDGNYFQIMSGWEEDEEMTEE